MMEYKGYEAKAEFDDEAGILHGEIINTRAVITFQATSTDQLRREMEASVDDYLEWCAERGKEPEKPREPFPPPDKRASSGGGCGSSA